MLHDRRHATAIAAVSVRGRGLQLADTGGQRRRVTAWGQVLWAAIGLYGGQEDNTFYRRSGDGIVVSGGRDLHTGDVALLGQASASS